MRSIKKVKFDKFIKDNLYSLSEINGMTDLYKDLSNSDLDLLLEVSKKYRIAIEMNSSWFDKAFVCFYLYDRTNPSKDNRYVFKNLVSHTSRCFFAKHNNAMRRGFRKSLAMLRALYE